MNKKYVILVIMALEIFQIVGITNRLYSSEQFVTTRIKGFFELDLHNNWYSVTNDTVSFRQHQAVIFINPMIGEKIDGMLTVSFEYGGGDIEIWTAYADYLFNPMFTLRWGVDLTPIGRWEIERIDIHERAKRIKPNVLYKGLFPQTSIGAFALGSAMAYKGDIVYRVGIVNNEDTVDKKLMLREDSTDAKAVVGRVGFDTDFGLNIGVSGYNGESFLNKVKVCTKSLYGIDCTYGWKKLKFVGEYIGAGINPVNNIFYTGAGYYLQAEYLVQDKVTVSYRYDKNDKNDTVITENMDEGLAQNIGFTFRPEPNYVVYCEYLIHKTEKDTVENKFMVSLGLTF